MNVKTIIKKHLEDNGYRILVFVCLKIIEISALVGLGYFFYFLWANVTAEQFLYFLKIFLYICSGIFCLVLAVAVVVYNWEWADNIIYWWKYRKY
jgi:hypothetical protein